jgi:hypothetical protein
VIVERNLFAAQVESPQRLAQYVQRVLRLHNDAHRIEPEFARVLAMASRLVMRGAVITMPPSRPMNAPTVQSP